MPSSAPNLRPSIVRVTYRMTDQMGVVYYANYFEYFEIGRTDLLRITGVTYKAMEHAGFFLPVIHAACDYLQPARYDDELHILTHITRVTRARIDFAYQITRGADTTTLAKGATHHAIVGPDGRPRRLNPEWHDRLAQLTPHP